MEAAWSWKECTYYLKFTLTFTRMISDHSCVCCVCLTFSFLLPPTEESKLCLPLEHVSLLFHSLSTLFFYPFFFLNLMSHLSAVCFQEAPQSSYCLKTQMCMSIIGKVTCSSHIGWRWRIYVPITANEKLQLRTQLIKDSAVKCWLLCNCLYKGVATLSS